MNYDELVEEIQKASSRYTYQKARVLIDVTEDLYTIMLEKGWGYPQLARATGMKKSRVRRFFQGDDRMTVRDVVRIAHAFGKQVQFTFIDRRKE